jgi:hypothetical protein
MLKEGGVGFKCIMDQIMIIIQMIIISY